MFGVVGDRKVKPRHTQRDTRLGPSPPLLLREFPPRSLSLTRPTHVDRHSLRRKSCTYRGGRRRRRGPLSICKTRPNSEEKVKERMNRP